MKLHLRPLFRKALLAAVCAASTYTLSANTLNLYILTGQSNSLGAVKGSPASAETLAEYSTAGISDIKLWNGSAYRGGSLIDSGAITWKTVAPHTPTYVGNLCMGPEYGFAHMMTRKGWEVNKATGDTIAIIKTSCDGGGNEYWVKGDAFYNRLVQTVKEAIDAIDTPSQYDTINIAGLMYLQGESNTATTAPLAEQRYDALLENLKIDLAASGYGPDVLNKLNILPVSVAGEPATSGYQTSDNGVGSITANQFMNMAENRDDMGWVFTRDLPKYTGENPIHYTGDAQITIGARYAYAMAREKGYDLTEGGTVSVRSQEYTGCAQYPAVGEYDASAAKTIHLNDDAAWWDGNAADKANVTAVWDVSSANVADTISADFAVGGIRVEDPIVHTVTINNASGSHTLSVGGSGIELQKGDLTVNTALATAADQTWTVAGERKLTLTGGVSGDHAVSLVRGGESAKAGQVSVTFGVTDSHAWSVGSGVEFSVLGSGDTITLDSVTLSSGATLNIGGKSAADLTINTLTATSGGIFTFNMADSQSYDHLTLGDASNLAGDFVFNITVNKKVTSTSYTLVDNWQSGSSYTGNITCANGVSGTLDVVGSSLVLTLTGTADGTADYINHNWPSVAETTSIPGTGGNFYAGDYGDSTHFQYRDDQGANSLYFFASKSAGSGDTYAELTSTNANWLAAFGSSSSSSAINVDGSASLMYTGDAARTHTVYGGVNGTISGNAYVELDNANGTYNNVHGLHNAHVGGKLTLVFNGGTYSGDVVAGADDAASTVGNGVYLQIEDGTFNNAVYGGSKAAATLDGGVHIVVNGGTFNSDFLGGNNSSGVINDGVEMFINGGTFKSWVFGAGYAGTINGDVHMTISGGTFEKADSIYAGGGSASTNVTGNSTITLKDIANGNSFLDYTGVLSGGHQNGSASGLGNGTTRTLELDHYTADSINATLTSFTDISAVNGTNTTLPLTTARGGATSISVDDTSTLKMAAEAANMGTLHGEGRIEITDGAGTNNTAFTLGADWTGTVALSGKVVGKSGNDVIVNFNNYGQEGSTIELTGFGANPGRYSHINAAGIFKADFVLNEDADGLGLFINAGSTGANYSFTGAWSGAGDFKLGSTTPAANFRFLGDMTGYTGDFISESANGKLFFGDGSVGASVGSVSGQGNISTSGDGAFELEYNYSNDVNVTNEISGNVSFVKKGAGKLTINSVNTYTGTTTVEAGTLKMESLGRTGTGAVIVKAGGAAVEVENFTLTGGTADSTITMLSGESLGAGTFSLQSIAVGAGSTLEVGGNLSIVNFTTGGGFQGTGSGTVTLSGDSSIGSATGARSTSGHHYLLTGGTTTFSNVDLTASGNAVAVDASGVGLSLADTVNVSGNISVGQYNTLTVAEGATAKVGSVLYATGQRAWSGGISIGANALLELTGTEGYSRVDTLTNNGTLHLNGAELRLHARSTDVTYNAGALAVTGSAKIVTDWNNTTINISGISGDATSRLTLCNDVYAYNATTFNLGTAGNADSTAQFSGTIDLSAGAAYTTTGQKTSVNLVIKETNVAANAVINFSSTSARANTFKLTLDATQVNVAGITDTLTHNDTPTITSASGTNTLGLTGSGDYAANVTLTNINIDKTGSGTQTFTGNASGVKGISVSDGTLVIKNAGTVNQTAMTVSGGGALIFGDSAGEHVTITAKENQTATVASGVQIDSANGAVSGSGEVSNANLSINSNNGYTLSSDLSFVNSSITSTGTGLVSISVKTGSTFDVLDVQGNGMALVNAGDKLNINELRLTSGQVFSAYKDAAAATPATENETTLQLKNLTTEGDATLNANLVFGNAAAEAYSLVMKGTVSMGSSVSFYTGGTLEIAEGVTMQVLFTSVDEIFINGVQMTADGEIFASKLFTNVPGMSGLRWNMVEGDGWTITYYSHIPEPATATLSLLALAALAARRRRKTLQTRGC